MVDRTDGRRLHDWALVSHQLAVMVNLQKGEDDKPSQPWDFMPRDLRSRRRPRVTERREFVTDENVGAITKFLTSGNGP